MNLPVSILPSAALLPTAFVMTPRYEVANGTLYLWRIDRIAGAVAVCGSDAALAGRGAMMPDQCRTLPETPR
jgi:hypothetical protein